MQINQLISDEIAHVNRMTMRANHIYSLVVVEESPGLLSEVLNATISALFPTIHPAAFPKYYASESPSPLNPQTVARFLAAADLEDTDLIFFTGNSTDIGDPISLDVGQEEVFFISTTTTKTQETQWQLDMVTKSSAKPFSFRFHSLRSEDTGFSNWVAWLVSQCDPDISDFYDPNSPDND